MLGADTMYYDVPIHPIPIGSIIKYNVREYGYFYGDGQEKRAITIAKIGKVVDIIEHDDRVVYYSVAPSSNCTFNQYFAGDCLHEGHFENPHHRIVVLVERPFPDRGSELGSHDQRCGRRRHHHDGGRLPVAELHAEQPQGRNCPSG